MIKTRITSPSRLQQGDIYNKIEHIEYIEEHDGILTISKIEFPYVIVLSQDCDLQQDSSDRKNVKTNPTKAQSRLLISVLVAPLYNIDHFIAGEHLSELKIKRNLIQWKNKNKQHTTEAKKILSNDNPRYHYLKFPVSIPIQTSIIDFKHYFSVSVTGLDRLRKKHFVCNVAPIYREDICQRFSNYLSRIGLPNS